MFWCPAYMPFFLLTFMTPVLSLQRQNLWLKLFDGSLLTQGIQLNLIWNKFSFWVYSSLLLFPKGAKDIIPTAWWLGHGRHWPCVHWGGLPLTDQLQSLQPVCQVDWSQTPLVCLRLCLAHLFQKTNLVKVNFFYITSLPGLSSQPRTPRSRCPRWWWFWVQSGVSLAPKTLSGEFWLQLLRCWPLSVYPLLSKQWQLHKLLQRQCSWKSPGCCLRCPYARPKQRKAKVSRYWKYLKICISVHDSGDSCRVEISF